MNVLNYFIYPSSFPTLFSLPCSENIPGHLLLTKILVPELSSVIWQVDVPCTGHHVSVTWRGGGCCQGGAAQEETRVEGGRDLEQKENDYIVKWAQAPRHTDLDHDPGCVTLDKLHPLHQPQFYHLWIGCEGICLVVCCETVLGDTQRGALHTVRTEVSCCIYLIWTQTAWGKLTKNELGGSKGKKWSIETGVEERMFHAEWSRFLFLCCLNFSADSMILFLSSLLPHRKAVVFLIVSNSFCQMGVTFIYLKETVAWCAC